MSKIEPHDPNCATCTGKPRVGEKPATDLEAVERRAEAAVPAMLAEIENRRASSERVSAIVDWLRSLGGMHQDPQRLADEIEATEREVAQKRRTSEATHGPYCNEENCLCGLALRDAKDIETSEGSTTGTPGDPHRPLADRRSDESAHSSEGVAAPSGQRLAEPDLSLADRGSAESAFLVSAEATPKPAAVLDPYGRRLHYLKTWPFPFEDVAAGRKPFEFRAFDRDFRVGDVLVLEKYDPHTKRYCGASVDREVTYTLPGGTFGVPDGYCVLGLKEPRHPLEDRRESPCPPAQGAQTRCPHCGGSL